MDSSESRTWTSSPLQRPANLIEARKNDQELCAIQQNDRTYAKIWSIQEDPPVFLYSDPSFRSLFRICTFSGGFSHSPKIFCFSHSSMPSPNSRSKFHTSNAIISLISKNARFLPIQSRLPYENGLCTSRRSSWNGEEGSLYSSGSQRSGWKDSGSWKLRGEWYAAS